VEVDITMGDKLRESSRGVLIWDIPTRLFHWLLVLCITGAFVSQWFYEHIPFWVHQAGGMTALVLVAFRVFWGFLGPRYARFSEFLRGPTHVLSYLRSLRRHPLPTTIGHTPSGAWMIVVLLALVGTQATLGLYSNDEMDSAGPLAGWLSHAVSNDFTRWHHRLGNVLLAAVGLHVAAVLFYKFALKHDLVRALWTGHRTDVPASAAIPTHHWGRAVVILLICGGALAALIAFAPPLPELLM